MDANPEADVDASSKVQEFLCLCINERRFSDAVKLLRSIKNRKDSWSGNVYNDIVKSVNEQTRSVLGRPLDLKGLGLIIESVKYVHLLFRSFISIIPSFASQPRSKKS